jgi:hypothetical protein
MAVYGALLVSILFLLIYTTMMTVEIMVVAADKQTLMAMIRFRISGSCSVIIQANDTIPDTDKILKSEWLMHVDDRQEEKYRRIEYSKESGLSTSSNYIHREPSTSTPKDISVQVWCCIM